MKIKEIVLVCILLAILTMGVVSAEEGSDFNETLTADIDDEVSVDASLDDEMISGESGELAASSDSDVIGDDSDEIINVDTETEFSTNEDDLDEIFASVTVPEGTNGNVTFTKGNNVFFNRALSDFADDQIDGDTYNIALREDGKFLFEDFENDDMFFVTFLDEYGDKVARKVYFINLGENTISFENDDSADPDNYEEVEGGLSIFIMEMDINSPYSLIKVSKWPEGIDDDFEISLKKDDDDAIVTSWNLNSLDRDRAGYAMWNLEDLEITSDGCYSISFLFTIDGAPMEIDAGEVDIWPAEEIGPENFDCWISTHESKDNHDAEICNVWINGELHGGTFILRIEKFDGTSDEYTMDVGDEDIRWKLEDLDIIDEVGVYTINLTYVNEDNGISLAENHIFELTQFNYNTCDNVYETYPFDVIRFHDENFIEVYVNGEKCDPSGENPYRWTLADLNIKDAGEYEIAISAYDEEELVENFTYTLNVNELNDEDIYFIYDNLGVESWGLDNPVLYLIFPNDMAGKQFKMFIHDIFFELEFEEGMNWTLEDLEIDHNDDYEIRLYVENEEGEDEERASAWFNVNGIISQDSFGWWISSHESIENSGSDICNVWLRDDIGEGTIILRIERFDGAFEEYSADVDDGDIQWKMSDLEILSELGAYTINLTYVIDDKEIPLAENYGLTLTKLGNYEVCEDVHALYPFEVIRFDDAGGAYTVEVYVNGVQYLPGSSNPFKWTLEDLNIADADEYEITISTYDDDGFIENFTYTLNVDDDASNFRAFVNPFGIERSEMNGPVLYLLSPQERIGEHLIIRINENEIPIEVTSTLMGWTLDDLGIDQNGNYEVQFLDEENDELDNTEMEVNCFINIYVKTEAYNDYWDNIISLSIPYGESGLAYVIVDGEVKFTTIVRNEGWNDGYVYGWRLIHLNMTQVGVYDVEVIFFNGNYNETLYDETIEVKEFANDTYRAKFDWSNYFELFCPEGFDGETINVSIWNYEDDEIVDVVTYEINSTHLNKWNKFYFEDYDIEDIGIEIEISNFGNVEAESYSHEEDDDEADYVQHWIDAMYGQRGPGSYVAEITIPFGRDVSNATVTAKSRNFTFTRKLSDFGDYEWLYGWYTYYITYEDLDSFESIDDKDIIDFTFEFENGKDTSTWVVQKEDDWVALYKYVPSKDYENDLFDVFAGDEDDENQYSLSRPDEEFAEAKIAEIYNVTVAEINITSNGRVLKYIKLTDFEDKYEFHYDGGYYMYARAIKFGEVDWSGVEDGDMIEFTLIYDGKIMSVKQRTYCVSEDDSVYFGIYDKDELRGTVHWGDIDTPEYGQSQSDGSFIIVDVPYSCNITEGTIMIIRDDTGEVIYQKSLSEFGNISETYVINATDVDNDLIPQNVNLTFAFDYNDTQLIFGRGIRIGDNMYRHAMPYEVEEYFSVIFPDEDILVNGSDNVIRIFTTDHANHQSVPIGIGSGYFSIYVNGEKVEDLGRLIRVDGETELDVQRLVDNFGRLYIYLDDLNITKNGVYDIKIFYEVDSNTATTGIYKTELYNNNITLTSNVKANYENESVEWLTGYGVDPVLLYLDTYYGDINSTTGTITVLNSDNATILTKNIKDLTYENGRYSLRYSDFTNKNFGDKITVKYSDGNERNGETDLDVLWKDLEPEDFNTTVIADLDDYYGNFINMNIPDVINTGQIIVTVKFKNNHSSNISNMNISTNFDSNAVYTFNVADIKANYENGKFGLSLSDLEFYEVDGAYDVDVKFTGDGTSILNVANKTFDVALSEDVIITINETSRFGLELPFATVQIFEPMGAYAELYIDGVLYSHKTFEKGLITFMSSPKWTPGVHTAEIKVVNSQFEVILNQSSTAFEVLTQSEGIEVTVPEIIKENELAYITFNAPVNGTLLIRVDNGNIELFEVHEGKNLIPLGSLAYGNHTVWMLYNETLENGSIAFYNNYLYIFAGDDGHWVDLPDPLVLNDDDTIRFDLGKDATGTISLYIDGVLYKVIDLVNGTGEIKIDEEFFNATGKYGLHNYTIIYSGDGTHPELIRNGTFNVEYLFRDNIPDEGFPLSDIYSIVITLPEDAKNNATFTIGNDVYNCPVVNGQATLELEGLDMGEYVVDISYLGDDRYPQTTYSKVLNVSYYGVVGYIKDGRRIVSLRLPGNAIGNLTIYNDNMNSKLYTKALVNGRASFDLTDLPVGIYDLRAVYEGNDYDVKAYNDHFKVMPYVYITQDVLMDDNVTIFMDLDNSTGYILIVMDGLSPVLQEIADGKINYTFSTKGYSYGNHTVTFQYFGKSFDGEIFYEEDSTGKLVPIKYDLRILGCEVNVNNASDSDNYLELRFSQDAKGTVEFFINGVKYAVVDIVDGIARLDISKFKNGKYLISWVYSGDSKYKSTKNDFYLTVSHKTAKIVAPDFKTLYTANKKYSVKVYDAKGKLASGVSVIFLINNKAYKTVKTDKKGIASVAIAQKPGTYKITAKALGTSVTKKLTVNHLLTLKKVKVKASAKKLVIKVTLKKVNGKYLKGKKITLKFNGKKFKAKTNKKGVAKFTVKSSVLKKLKAGKKVKYQATYKKDTVKQSVKVKK
ncbi:hypothetical protein [Methanobrevibacter sp.]|uniref:hypothetical protein n=1 Tax=Methanobrevibacter sp. TaxID=66852 RepID=UPI0025E158A5|nr:hypothetical protein [Methanobrevibacter sp.]MBR4448309.1 hypothetical protein [Methanobrevibacter sp.]